MVRITHPTAIWCVLTLNDDIKITFKNNIRIILNKLTIKNTPHRTCFYQLILD